MKVALEAASICQLKCPLCPTAKRTLGAAVGHGVLKLDAFERFIDDNPQVREIELSNWGEIALNPHLPKILEKAHAAGVALTAANGMNFNRVSDELLEAMVKYRFRFISCSIDGATQQTYQIYRRGGNLGDVLANLRKLNALKQKYGSPYPHLQWQFVIFPHNRHEIERAKEMAAELGMRFHLKSNDWEPGTKARRFDQPERNAMVGHICSQLWRQPQINWDGKLLGCCVNHWGDFGNAFDESLDRIVSVGGMAYARKMLAGEAPPREDIPCTKCGNYRDMRMNNSWLRVERDSNGEWRWSWFAKRETPLRKIRRIAGGVSSNYLLKWRRAKAFLRKWNSLRVPG